MTSQGPYFLGIDGGGTGCRARLETSSGTILGRGQSGPATTRLGIDNAWTSIMAAAEAAMMDAGFAPYQQSLVHAAAGVAGLSRPGAREALQAKPHPFARLTFISDGVAACLGAHSGRDGGVVVAGTGSIAIGRVDGRNIRAGGYGFPASDEGSGADIGLKAIGLALKAHDGRHAASPLLAAILHQFHNDPAEVIPWMDRASGTDYATFAPLVFRHANAGDVAGQGIVNGAAHDIEQLINALLALGAPRVSLLGGIAVAIEPWLASPVRATLIPADGDAVSGAIIHAKAAL